ncbi:unnamed protein product, partial [Brassica oleracea]
VTCSRFPLGDQKNKAFLFNLIIIKWNHKSLCLSLMLYLRIRRIKINHRFV